MGTSDLPEKPEDCGHKFQTNYKFPSYKLLCNASVKAEYIHWVCYTYMPDYIASEFVAMIVIL